MATVWSIVANWILPIPLTMFILLSLPLPRSVRQGIILFIQRVMDLRLVGAFKMLHVMLWLTAVAFLSSARQVHQMHQSPKDTVWSTPNMEISFLSKRWRAERNLWIAAFAFSSWVFLAAYYREAVRRLQLEARMAEMERSDFTVTETRDREQSVGPRGGAGGGEVTSKAAVASANKTAPPPAAAEMVGSPARGPTIQMQALKKDM